MGNYINSIGLQHYKFHSVKGAIAATIGGSFYINLRCKGRYSLAGSKIYGMSFVLNS